MGGASSSELEGEMDRRAVELDKREVELDKREVDLDKRAMELEKRAETRTPVRRNSQELEMLKNCGCWFVRTVTQSEEEPITSCPDSVCSVFKSCAPESIDLGQFFCC